MKNQLPINQRTFPNCYSHDVIYNAILSSKENIDENFAVIDNVRGFGNENVKVDLENATYSYDHEKYKFKANLYSDNVGGSVYVNASDVSYIDFSFHVTKHSNWHPRSSIGVFIDEVNSRSDGVCKTNKLYVCAKKGLLFHNGITLIFSLIEEMVYQRIGSVSKDFGNINNYFRFLENPVESDSYTNSILINGAIRLDNVSFSYPNSTVKALDHVSLTLEHGESLAIVGENGSGKSTLSKIMMGLFTPQDGRVFYGSENIKAADRKILFSKVSAVFQDFSKYKLNLRTNIKISSDIDKSDDELAKLCKTTNLDIYGEQFPDQLDTIEPL